MYEDDFILNAARINLSEKEISCLQKLSSKNLDWDSLAIKAAKHGVQPLIYYSLKNNALDNLIPNNIFEIFKKDYYTNAVRNSLILEDLYQLYSIVKEPVIPLKGVDLIQNLYPSIALRSMCDIDILVKKKNAEKIWKMLLKKGYRESNLFTIYKSGIHKKFSNLCYSSHHLSGLFSKYSLIEVHWNMFREYEHYKFTEKAWNESISLDSSNHISRLSNEFMLIHLCSHFYQHLSDGPVFLRMLCDINEFIIKHYNTIHWDYINEIFTGSRLRTEISIALVYVHVLFKTPVPLYFIDKKILNNKPITLDSLLNTRLVDKQKSVRIYNARINKFQKPAEKIIYIIRTIVPKKEWINHYYKTNQTNNIITAYLKFWVQLFYRYILKKSITLEN